MARRIINQQTVFRLMGCTALYAVLFQLTYDWMYLGSPIPDGDWLAVLASIGVNYVPMLAVAFAAWMISNQTVGIRKVSLKILVDCLCMVPVWVGINLLFGWITGMDVNWGGTLFNAILIIVTTELVVYFLQLNTSLQQQELHRRELLLKRYELVKTKVNPHFLFNSLNMLYSMIEISPERSKELLVALSNYYRMLLKYAERDVIPLADELALLQEYIRVVSMRYDEALQVHITGEAKGGMMIANSLQIVVENVVKHNHISKDCPMEITISLSAEQVEVKNPIHKRLSSSSTGFGLSYLNEIYSLYDLQLSFQETDDTYCVTLPIIPNTKNQ